MHLLTTKSEEGKLSGLNLIESETIRFPENKNFKVPHMGWNTVKPINNTKLIDDINFESKFYFVHSYYVTVKNQRNSSMKSNYGIEFDSAIEKGNVYGVQFHPEKSHKFGMKLLKKFCQL